MIRKRVKYVIKGTNELGIGFLRKNKNYSGGFYVLSGDKKSRISISLLKYIGKI